MNDPVPAAARWSVLLVLGAAVVLRSSAGPDVLRIAVLALAGLAVLPVLGWLRTLWFTPVAIAGVAAWISALVMHLGHAVPVAAIAGVAAAVAVGALSAVATGRMVPGVRPWLSLLIVVTVWALVLPRVGPAPAPAPLLFGVDLSGERAVAGLALVLLAMGVWVVGNLSRSRVGRQIGAAGSSSSLAQLSGASPLRVWLRAGVVSGVLAGFAGVLLAVDVQAVPAASQFSPATAVTWLAVPLLGGPAWVSGVLAGAVLIGAVPALAPVPEAALAGVGLAVAALTRGHGLVGHAARRWSRSS